MSLEQASSSAYESPLNSSGSAAAALMTATWTTDMDIEFDKLPGYIFPVNSHLLGLPLDPNAKGILHPVSASASSQATLEIRRRMRVRDYPPFCPNLVTAFRVVEDSFALDETQGTARLIDRALFVLQSGSVQSSEHLSIIDVLSALAVHASMGLDSSQGHLCAIRVREMAKGCLDDIVLVREVLSHLAVTQSPTLPPPSPVEQVIMECLNCKSLQSELTQTKQELDLAKNKVALMEKENRRLLRALEDAYFGGGRQQHAISTSKATPRGRQQQATSESTTTTIDLKRPAVVRGAPDSNRDMSPLPIRKN